MCKRIVRILIGVLVLAGVCDNAYAMKKASKSAGKPTPAVHAAPVAKPAAPAVHAAAAANPCTGTVVVDAKIRKLCPQIPASQSDHTKYTFPAAAGKAAQPAKPAAVALEPFQHEDLDRIKAQFAKLGLGKKTTDLKKITAVKTGVVTLTKDNPIQLLTFVPSAGKNAGKGIKIVLAIKHNSGMEGMNIWSAAIYKEILVGSSFEEKVMDKIGPFSGKIGFKYTINPDGTGKIRPMLDSSAANWEGYSI